jgi:Zn-dependent protease with chaperone function
MRLAHGLGHRLIPCLAAPCLAATAIVFAVTALAGQARITPPANRYTPAQDVELGRQAAAQVEQQLPVMHDDEVTSYVESVGRRLVAAIPPELQHQEFQYTFKAVNVREINAFALPGGPMFINRGMIEAAHTEGEVAGVMAHELSHVVLRHGTAQSSKATRYQVGEIAGALLGAIVGGRAGNAISQVTQLGVGAAFLRFSREYEQQADLEGTHLMARAGYDPREMANVFKTIEQQGGPGGPQWLSDHPNPGNRFEYITREAATLRVENQVRDTRGFEQVQAHLRRLPQAPTTEEATKKGARPAGNGAENGPPRGRVDTPSSRFKTYTEGNLFRVSVPANWREVQSSSSVTFVPDGAYGQVNGNNVFTHGVEIGIARNETHDLDTATGELIDSLAQGNPRLTRPAGYRRVSLDGRPGLRAALSNLSETTGRPERIEVVTTLMRDGNLLYAIAIAPREDYRDYENAFERVMTSIQLADNPR